VTVAVKKATAKKSVVKKSAVRATKKSAPKKATSKATTVKKTTAKKTAVKKSAKKAAVKKSVAKKSAVKKTAKKAVTRRTPAKKAVEGIVIPEAPITAQRSARVEIVTTPAPLLVAPAPSTPAMPSSPVTPAPAVGMAPASEKKPGASGRVVFAVVVGIILLGLIVWAKGHNSNPVAQPSTTPTSTASATPTDTASPTPTPSDTSATIIAHEAPQGVVAHYTSTGATIFWKAPTALDGLTGYNVEISVSNGPWKLISTVPVAQLSLDVKKESTSGWTSFKVSSVYSDSQTVAAKAFGLPGTYS
jgi:hypothetical protein